MKEAAYVIAYSLECSSKEVHVLFRSKTSMWRRWLDKPEEDFSSLQKIKSALDGYLTFSFVRNPLERFAKYTFHV